MFERLELGARLRAKFAAPISYEELRDSIRRADEDLANGRTVSLSVIMRDMNKVLPAGGAIVEKGVEADAFEETFEAVQSERPDFDGALVAEAVAKALNLPTAVWKLGEQRFMSVEVDGTWRDYPAE